MTLIRFSAAMALALALAPASAWAQAKCEIDEKKPNQVKDAANLLTRAELPLGKPEDKLKQVTQAVTLLTKEPEKLAANAAGRNWLLGRAYVALAAVPGNEGAVSRASVGIATSPEGTIDLVAAADTAFDALEAAMPGCRDQTEEYRRGVYAKLVNEAVNIYNQQKVDSAGALATRALSIYDGYPLSYIAYNILGNVQQSKDDISGAVGSFQKMAALMKGDTALVDERKNVMVNVGQLLIAQGENLEGDAKKAKMQEASTYLQAFLAEFPGDAKAQGALARAQIASGDAAAAERVFGEMIAGPDKYSDTQLFEAGVNAARAERPKEASQLFMAGLKKNPYSRDGLFNLSVTLQNMEQWDEMRDPLTRLIAIDPENPDNYRLWATYYQGRAKGAKDAAAKKPATSPEAKAYAAINDSLLKYFERMQKAPVKVGFNLWAHDGTKHTLAGSVENLTEGEKSYTLKFEFLNAAGNVVTSKEAVVEGVASKTAKSFRLEVDGEGIVAFRYAPLGG